LNSKNLDYNASLNQTLFTGTSYNIAFNNTRVRTNQAFTSVNPRFDTSLFASVTQPLMRGFGLQITETPLHIAQKNQKTFDYRLRQRMMDIGLQVEQVYWDLVFARRDLDVKKQALGSAKDLYENNKKQVEVGTMAPLEIVVAEAEVATREEDIITVESLIQNTEDHLKTLILGGKDVENWPAEVYPADEPILNPISMTEEEATQRALADNPDLKALETDLESKTLSARLASNQLKPQLDFKAQYGYSGLGGTTLLLDNNTFPPTVIGTVPGGYPDALSNLFNNRTWAVGFVVGIPIGNGSAQANYARADLTEKQANKTLESARQQIILNVRTTFHNLQSDAKRLDAARVSRVLQEKKLDAERKKLAVGLSTNHVVLQFQDDLATAQSAELQAMVDYNKDEAQLHRYMGNTIP
jgi:outer membrane protein